MILENETIREVYQFPEDYVDVASKKKRRGHKKVKTNQHVLYFEQKKKEKSKKKGVYFRIRVIGKIAQFVNKLKSGAILNDPKLKNSELPYLDEDSVEKKSNQAFIKYDSQFSLIIQFLVWAFLSINLWKASFEIVQGSLFESKEIETMGIAGVGIFAIITLNSEMRNKKMGLINDKDQIKEYYKEKILIYDIFVIIGFILRFIPFGGAQEVMFYISRTLILFVVVHVSEVFQRIQQRIAISRERQSVFVIIKLMLRVFIFLHINSLLLNAFAKLEKEIGVQTTWIEYNGFDGLKNYEVYIFGWYWCCTIMSTVGFGDINPTSKNIYEAALISIIQLVCCIFFGYFLNYIGSALNIFGEKKSAYEKKIRRLNNFFGNVDINEELKNQARSHIFNKYKSLQLFDQEEEDEILGELTETLKENIIQVNNKHILLSSKLNDQFSEEFLSSLTDSLQKKLYSPEEFVFENHQKQINLWIVSDGSIHQIPKKSMSKKPLTIYNKKDNSAGWINFLTGQSYESSGWADSFTITYKLNREKFLSKLKHFKSNFLQFHQIKQYLILKESKYLKKCLGCGKMSHNIMNCSRLHFIPKKLSYMLSAKKQKAESNGQNKRKRAPRRSKKNKNQQATFIFIKDKTNKSIESEKQINTSNQKYSSSDSSSFTWQKFKRADQNQKQNKKKSVPSQILNFITSFRTFEIAQQNKSQTKSIPDEQQSLKQQIPKQSGIIFDSVLLSEGNAIYRVEDEIENILKKVQKYKQK